MAYNIISYQIPSFYFSLALAGVLSKARHTFRAEFVQPMYKFTLGIRYDEIMSILQANRQDSEIGKGLQHTLLLIVSRGYATCLQGMRFSSGNRPCTLLSRII